MCFIPVPVGDGDLQSYVFLSGSDDSNTVLPADVTEELRLVRTYSVHVLAFYHF